MNQEQIEKEIHEIKERNARVETDKAWEISGTRKFSIAVFTYLIAAVWLIIIKDNHALLKALVPVAGYLLSTLSLPIIKNNWSKKRNN